MGKTSIQYIKEAVKKLVGCKMKGLGATEAQEAFDGVMQTVGLDTREEACLFAALFDLTLKDKTTNMDDLSSYFSCSYLDVIEYVPALKSLEAKGLIVRRGRRESNIIKQDFIVSDAAMESVIGNQPVRIHQVTVEDEKIDKYDFCRSVVEKVDDHDVQTGELAQYAENMEIASPHLTFVEGLKNDEVGVYDRILFYCICYDHFNTEGEGSSDLDSLLKKIFSNYGLRFAARMSVMEGENVLTKRDYIELDESDGEEEVRLTEKGLEFFYGDEVQAFGKSYKSRDMYGFLRMVHSSFHDKVERKECGVPAHVIKKLLTTIEYRNRHLPGVSRVRSLIPDECERVLFYCVGHNLTLTVSRRTSLSFELLVFSRDVRKRWIEEFKNKTHNLQARKLVDVEKRSSLFGEETQLFLTDTGIEQLLGEDASLFIEEASDKSMLSCDKIESKRLFFQPDLERQLSLLRNSLDQSYYKGLRARLEEKHMAKGVAVLFYGEPGTGKTESAMQIAKATGRAVMHVDISATKTCWFGESEKLIKKVFTDYRRLCEKSEVAPILLFNEADAVFSKRKDVNRGDVAQTENAIQNIILEEMENLDGILIATTNLADNLDTAFERRFLFKVRFDKPTVEAKTNIWRDKIPSLSIADAETLAAGFDFSGGQIDNIVRKTLMKEIVEGVQPTLCNLQALCREEKISKNSSKRVGFNN